MEANSTLARHPWIERQSQQQASGRSLFWGLAAISVNAMMQPSVRKALEAPILRLDMHGFLTVAI